MKAYLARATIKYINPNGWINNDEDNPNDIFLGLFSTHEKAEECIFNVNVERFATDFSGESIYGEVEPDETMIYNDQIRAVQVPIAAGWKLFIGFHIFTFEMDKPINRHWPTE